MRAFSATTHSRVQSHAEQGLIAIQGIVHALYGKCHVFYIGHRNTLLYCIVVYFGDPADRPRDTDLIVMRLPGSAGG